MGCYVTMGEVGGKARRSQGYLLCSFYPIRVPYYVVLYQPSQFPSNFALILFAVLCESTPRLSPGAFTGARPLWATS